jgi:hypothetical protein
MTDQSIAKVKDNGKDLSLEEYGSREDIKALARRVKVMLPGGNRMSDAQAMALAQYSIATNANPFRGEIYGFESRGQFVLVDGYKLLVRWAKRQCPYSEKYERLAAEELQAGAIGIRCRILRDDARDTLRDLVSLGAEFSEAFELASTDAVGVVTKDEMKHAPPKGWTWEQVARKRALKNTLNLSHGAPSPREIAKESWMVDDKETKPEDWADVEFGDAPYVREQKAVLNATTREHTKQWQSMTEEEQRERFEHNQVVLHGSEEDEI